MIVPAFWLPFPLNGTCNDVVVRIAKDIRYVNPRACFLSVSKATVDPVPSIDKMGKTRANLSDAIGGSYAVEPK